MSHTVRLLGFDTPMSTRPICRARGEYETMDANDVFDIAYDAPARWTNFGDVEVPSAEDIFKAARVSINQHLQDEGLNLQEKAGWLDDHLVLFDEYSSSTNQTLQLIRFEPERKSAQLSRADGGLAFMDPESGAGLTDAEVAALFDTREPSIVDFRESASHSLERMQERFARATLHETAKTYSSLQRQDPHLEGFAGATDPGVEGQAAYDSQFAKERVNALLLGVHEFDAHGNAERARIARAVLDEAMFRRQINDLYTEVNMGGGPGLVNVPFGVMAVHLEQGDVLRAADSHAFAEAVEADMGLWDKKINRGDGTLDNQWSEAEPEGDPTDEAFREVEKLRAQIRHNVAGLTMINDSRDAHLGELNKVPASNEARNTGPGQDPRVSTIDEASQQDWEKETMKPTKLGAKTIQGNLVEEPRMVQTATSEFLALRVAETQSKFDRDTQAWAEQDPTYYDVAVRPGAMADNIQASLHKGHAVAITGNYQVEAWSTGDKAGLNHKVFANDVSASLRFNEVDVVPRAGGAERKVPTTDSGVDVPPPAQSVTTDGPTVN